MERELERRRGWPWKNRRNLGLSIGSDGGSPSATVKLFDEQEVARILQDQVRIGDEQMVEALNAATAKHADKERAWSEKLTAANHKLAAATSEITIKDNLVKQHIKVAEEAVAGWEKAESVALELKAELESVRRTMEERLQEVHGVREEHDKHLHETIVKKTREFDVVRVEMEVKLVELSKSASESRTQLVEAQAENEALNLALKDRSRMIAELHDIRAHAETDSKILRVRLEGLEKESFDLKYKVHSLSKDLEIRSAELEYGKKTSDVLSRQHTDSVKKIVKLEDECNRLRMMVRKKLPNTAAIVRMKQELDALGKDSGSDSGRPGRRRPLNRSHSSGVPADFLPESLLQDATATAAERIATMDEETRMLKEALTKRNDELQASRLMCAKTASRLTAVEDELEMLRSGSPDLASPRACSTSSASSRRVVPKNGSQKYSDSAAEADVHSQPEFQLEEKSRELEEATRMCEELRRKLTAAENQFSALQSRNAANEQSVIALQDRLDTLLESHENIPEAEEHIPEAVVTAPEISVQLQSELATAAKSALQATQFLAQVLILRSPPEDGSSTESTHWQDPGLESSMSNLASIANKLRDHKIHESVNLLSSALSSITEICNTVTQKLQEDAEEVQVRVSGLETEVQQLQVEKEELVLQIHEANESVDKLKEQVKEAESAIAELRLHQDHQRHEDDLIEEELLELSSSHPQLLKSMRAADAEMNELHAKVAALEVELHGERRRHHEVVAKLEDLQEQIHRGVGRNVESGSSAVHGKELLPAFMGEDEISKSARQEREISAAALAECQRTILALGKQLKILGFADAPDLTRLKGADSPDSIKRMTETMELLRWQTESSAPPGPPPPRKLGDFSSDGPVSVPASPARSDLEAPSTPESPAAGRRTVNARTVRSFHLQKHAAEDCAQGKFHDRSLSESSASSGLSNGNSR